MDWLEGERGTQNRKCFPYVDEVVEVGTYTISTLTYILKKFSPI